MIGTNTRYIEQFDEKRLSDFYINVYGKNHILNNPIHHNWQFKNPFTSKYKSIIIVENEEKILSHMGLSPFEIKVFDKKFDGVFEMSYYTKEEYRGQGIGSKILELIFSGFDSTSALSITKPSQSLHLKFGGKYFENINRFIKILNQKRLEHFLNKKLILSKDITLKNSHKFERIKYLDKNYTDFWNKVRKRYPITVERTIKYLDWRYLHHPLINYHFLVLIDKNEIVGYSIIRFEDQNDELKAARIVDLIVFESYELIILKNIINYCDQKVDFIDFYCTGDFYLNTLEKCGFFNNLRKNLMIPTLFNPIDKNRNSINFYFYVKSDLSNKEKLYDQNNLFFVKGDSDQDRGY